MNLTIGTTDSGPCRFASAETIDRLGGYSLFVPLAGYLKCVMELRKGLGSWVAAGANVAVLVGLIFVAVQIRQGTASVRAAAYQTWVAAATEFNMGIATDPELGSAIARGHFEPGSLDETAGMQYAMSMLAVMQMTQATYYLYRDGSIDRELWDAELQRAVGHLTFPGVRQWWDAGARTQLAPEFVRVVESTAPALTAWSYVPGEGFKPLPAR